MTDTTDLYENTYEHCDTQWVERGDSMHNDRCPVCNKEIQPTDSLELATGAIFVH